MYREQTKKRDSLPVHPLTGKMFAATAETNGALYSIDTATAVDTFIGNFGSGLGVTGDLVFLDNVLYAAGSRVGYTNYWLAKINVVTGQATLIGDMGHPSVWGLAVRSGSTMHAVTSGGKLLKVNVTTGATTLVGSNGSSQGGLTNSPNW